MKKALMVRVLLMAINLRNPLPGLIHHTDRGSQDASRAWQKLLRQHGIPWHESQGQLLGQ